MTKKIALLVVLAACILALFPIGAAAAARGPIPGIDVISVVPGTVVTIQTRNFPASLDFDVIIGPYGKYGLTGYKVATTNSGKGGAFTVTYNIPPEYKDSARLAIRLTNKSKGYYAYNWFENAVPPVSATATPAKPPIPGYSGYPSISIQAVAADTNVTLSGKNFPPGRDLSVFMNVIGTRGKNGYKAGAIRSADDGSFNSAFDLPAELKGLYMISIRVVENEYGYYGYNWFFNRTYPVVAPTTSATPAPTLPAYSGYPQLEINSVVMDSKVTLQASNLPKNESFEVYLGTLEQMVGGGSKVATLESGENGSATLTLDIPAALKGAWKISVRIVSTSSGTYGYNWFYNQTYP